MQPGDTFGVNFAVERSLKGNVLDANFGVLPCDTDGGGKRYPYEHLPSTGSMLGNVALYGGAIGVAGAGVMAYRRRFTAP